MVRRSLFLRLKTQKRAAIELWKAIIPLKKIREQLKMRRCLRNVLAYAKEHPEDPVQKRRKNATFFHKFK